jgi:hypothetical protein
VRGLFRLLSAIWIIAVVIVSGCGHRRFANENDVLRARVLELEMETAAMKKRNTELEAELAAMTAPPASLSPEIAAATPHVTGITIGRLSHLCDDDGDGAPDKLIVYVIPADGRGRFIQLVGQLSLEAALLPTDDEPRTIARAKLSPGEVRDAYRSSFTGTHYTIEAPVSLPADAAAFEKCDVRVTYDDGRSGRRFEAHRAIPLR